MAVKTQVVPVTKTTVVQAVQTWAKAETSAIWALIRVVSRGLAEANEGDRGTRLKSLKQWVNEAAEEAWGPGASKDRAAHISKIFTIAENATPKHYERWTKLGTGFYKAYSEFAVPQAKPASKKTAPASTPAPVPAEPDQKELEKTAKAAAEAKEVTVGAGVGTREVDGPPRAGEGAGSGQLGSAQYAAEQGLSPAPDPTEGWAARIDMDKSNWKRLLDHLSAKQQFILDPEMVMQVMQAAGKKAILLRNAVALMLQADFIKEVVVDFIKENPQLFDGISVDQPKKTKAVA